MNVNWNLYRQFYYVAKYGSTAAASKELMIAQPSVSLGIRQLENQLGCELFKRSYKGMELTEQGVILYENISSAFNSINKAEEFISRFRQKEINTVNIAVIDTTLQLFLLPILESFRKLNPAATIKIHICKEVADAEKLMDSRTADFAVMHFASEEARFVNTAVKKISDILVCSEQYKDMFANRIVKAQQLKEYSLVSLNKNSPSRKVVDEYLEACGLEIDITHEFMHVSSIIRHIKQSFSLGFVLENVIKDELEQGGLMKINLEPPIPPRYYYMIRPTGELSPLVQKLVDYILSSRTEL